MMNVGKIGKRYGPVFGRDFHAGQIGLGTDFFGAVLDRLGPGDVSERGFSVVVGVRFIEVAFGDRVASFFFGDAATDIDEFGSMFIFAGELPRVADLIGSRGVMELLYPQESFRCPDSAGRGAAPGAVAGGSCGLHKFLFETEAACPIPDSPSGRWESGAFV